MVAILLPVETICVTLVTVAPVAIPSSFSLSWSENCVNLIQVPLPASTLLSSPFAGAGTNPDDPPAIEDAPLKTLYFVSGGTSHVPALERNFVLSAPIATVDRLIVPDEVVTSKLSPLAIADPLAIVPVLLILPCV